MMADHHPPTTTEEHHHMSKPTKPWTSGFCAPGNPPASHLRCTEHQRTDKPCACPSDLHSWDEYHPNAPRPEDDDTPVAPPLEADEATNLTPELAAAVLEERKQIPDEPFARAHLSVWEAPEQAPAEFAPGWHPELDEAVYHAHRSSLSVSGAKLILRAPALFAWDRDHPSHKRVFELGSAAHKVALGAGPELVVVRRTYPPTKAEPLGRAEDAEGYQSNSAKEHRDAIREAGGIPVLRSELEQIERMAAKLREHKRAMEVMSGKGTAELSAFAVDEETGVLRRGRFDWLGSHLVTDYKTTTSADPQVWARSSLAQYGYDQQADWYLWLARTLGHPALGFAFVLQEKDPPYLVSVVEVDQQTLDAGAALNRRALEVYRDCEAAGVWPGYVPDDEHRTVSAPYWRLLEAGVAL